MQGLGALAVADAQVVEGFEQVVAVVRSPAPRVIHSASIDAAPPLSAGSYAAPAGKSSENDADCTPGIVSATSTRPLGNVCCWIMSVGVRGGDDGDG